MGRRLRGVAYLCVLGMVAGGCTAPKRSNGEASKGSVAVAPAFVGEPIVTQPASGQLWFDRLTEAQVNATLGTTNRLISIQVAQTTPSLLFSGTYVPNSGAYHVRSWNWYPGLTATDLVKFNNVMAQRPISLDVYASPQDGSTRFATVMVSNQGTDSHGWWSYFGTSLSDLTALIQQNNARLIDFRRESNGATSNFVALMVPNTGPDATQSWWYPAQTTDQIDALLTTNNAIVVSLAPADTTGTTFDVVMNQAPDPAIGAGWFRNLTMAEFTATLTQFNARPVDFKSYFIPDPNNNNKPMEVFSAITVQNVWSTTQQNEAACDASVVADWQANPPATGLGTSATTAAYDCEFRNFLRQNPSVSAASVAVTMNGKLVLARSYGLSDQDEVRIVHPDNLFRVASVSKSITAAAVFKLMEQFAGVTLSTKVFPLLGLSPNPMTDYDHTALNSITVKNLLEMAGGFDPGTAGAEPSSDASPPGSAPTCVPTGGERLGDPVGPFDEYQVETTQNLPTGVCTLAAGSVTCGLPPQCDQIIQWVISQPDWKTMPWQPAGTVNAYSNFGYCVLGALIEKVTGTDYGTWVTNNLLLPAGAADVHPGQTLWPQDREVTYYSRNGLEPSILEKSMETSVYTEAGTSPSQHWFPAPYGGYYLEGSPASGGWIASSVDLMRFDVQLAGFNGKTLISPADYQQMTSDTGLPDGNGDCSTGAVNNNAMGWSIDTQAPHQGYVQHGGDLDGNTSIHVITPNGFTFTALVNAGPIDGSLYDELNAVFDGQDQNDGCTTHLQGASSTWFSGDLFDQYGPYTSWMTLSQYQTYASAQESNGLYPSRVEAVNHTGTAFYRAVFAPFKGAAFESQPSMDCLQYQATDAQLKAEGYTTTSLQSYVSNDGTRRYQATWVNWSACSPSCTKGNPCTGNADCASGVCTNGVCGPSSCSPTCGLGQNCGANSDCVSGQCVGGKCAPPSCSPTCSDGSPCTAGGDCGSGVCTANKCAPPGCATPPSKCTTGATCGAASDCGSGVCVNGLCQAPSCSPTCGNGSPCSDNSNCLSKTCGSNYQCKSPPCATQPGKCNQGSNCGQGSDCGSGICTSGICAAPACQPNCINSTPCNNNGDCATKVCTNNMCQALSCAPHCLPWSPCGSNHDCQSGVCTASWQCK